MTKIIDAAILIAAAIAVICGGIAFFTWLLLWEVPRNVINMAMERKASAQSDDNMLCKYRNKAFCSRKAREIIRKIKESKDAKTIKNLTEELENL